MELENVKRLIETDYYENRGMHLGWLWFYTFDYSKSAEYKAYTYMNERTQEGIQLRLFNSRKYGRSKNK